MEFIGKDEDQASWSKHYIEVKSLIVSPKKTHKVTVKTKNGGSYSYNYASLSDVDNAVMQACNQVKDKDNKVAFSYFFDTDDIPEGYIGVSTILVDCTGYMAKVAKVYFPKCATEEKQQDAGSLTFAKRYSLSAAFGIASETDDEEKRLAADQQKPTVRVLDASELDKYEVSVFGRKQLLKDVWEDYLENPNGDSRKWLTSQKDPQTNQAIQQLLDQFNLNKKIAAIENDYESTKPKKEKRSKSAKEPSPKLKDEPKRDESDDEIKKLVDGNSDNADKQDPFKDKIDTSNLDEIDISKLF